jgi:glyoxylase-like metal-dependent hydrolase (beta-lactamase superfamily II)
VWSNTEVKEYFNIPLYTPKDDIFMLEDKDGLNYNVPTSYPDFCVDLDEQILLKNNIQVQFIHLPGHTPGTSIIIIGDYIFSGDFVFKNSIGRVDFPYSSALDMKKSIKKFINLDLSDKIIFTGHGDNTSLYVEQDRIQKWI